MSWAIKWRSNNQLDKQKAITEETKGIWDYTARTLT